MVQYKGVSKENELKSSSLKKDTRTLLQKYRDSKGSPDGLVFYCIAIPILMVIFSFMPFMGELILLLFFGFIRNNLCFSKMHFDFPYRVPRGAEFLDGSKKGEKKGEGIIYLGNDIESELPVYEDNSDSRTHHLVLGTTGSGKTEFLLGLVANALVQNTGFIYVDGKGDPKLQSQVFRLLRLFGREADGLIINFIMSGRDLVDKQTDKITNTMNMMGNTSSGMLIELIVSLMDDSGGGGDMWKGRAISFVSAITRPLVYMRDKGFITLSPESYLNYFELHVLEELVFEHNGRYGDNFDFIVAPLRSYLKTLPGYQDSKRKKQETKTLEQHGFITMQLLRIFNDLTFNYGHIFKVKIGDVDFYDVVVNRRCLVALLPALERAPDSMKMLGKMIVGAIKQMMAGCLGNRVEGVVREIIESRPTNSDYPFYTILDEYGYYAVAGFAVAPAQARSIGFSITFAAQDFSSLKKSSAEEADATWENTNVRAIGKLTSGEESETWKRIVGAASTATQAEVSGYDRVMGTMGERFATPGSVSFSNKQRIHYDDFAAQENGEFTFIIGKKEKGGETGGVRVIRGMGFYTASETPKEMRINDMVPVEPPEPHELPETKLQLETFINLIAKNQLSEMLNKFIESSPVLDDFSAIIKFNDSISLKSSSACLTPNDLTRALLGYYCKLADGEAKPFKLSTVRQKTVVNSEEGSTPSTYSDDSGDDEILLSTEAKSLSEIELLEAELVFSAVADNSITEELLDLAQHMTLNEGENLNNAGLRINAAPEILPLVNSQPVEKENDSEDDITLLRDSNAYDRYLKNLSPAQVAGFNQHMKVYFDFGSSSTENENSPLQFGLNKLDSENRSVMSAMYHAQLMSIFSRGDKPTARQIREIKDDVENEYQRLLNSTSYLNGVEPEKVDAETIRESISLLGEECGIFVLKNLKD
ncbi:FtsK/SpoIIIE domain-containing protein [Acerihabitans sp. TG2]|uniref:FtsK/SpoIIIE domain-containing protein n=1 Tax=Acerihabitans sp. TG2 TaxID=3096008 RepID=UPI002B236609|nr:FtsK/SpoIIIE domain-containing protein [Acerihabitans sp. TG2]MEA9392214.1 FtsK/SpoIIIE domain-containing protein [Acerihabitans sp. TG2]